LYFQVSIPFPSAFTPEITEDFVFMKKQFSKLTAAYAASKENKKKMTAVETPGNNSVGPVSHTTSIAAPATAPTSTTVTTKAAVLRDSSEFYATVQNKITSTISSIESLIVLIDKHIKCNDNNLMISLNTSVIEKSKGIYI
jgi:hypothetical protein